jgi:CCR4-NOT transcription complex subunit 7/8
MASADEIMNVWDDNIETEIDKITQLSEKYNYISMDTEFPGVVIQGENLIGYQFIKSNVDELKLIQVGITLADEHGNSPKPISTWQFNLKFDLNTDKFANESINLLKEAGIDFDQLAMKGIPELRFADMLLSSGLILNDDVHWITFHGAFDFGYLIKSVSNAKLPKNLDSFNTTMKTYFPTVYDLKIIVNEVPDLKNGSLTKLGHDLEVKRSGIQHQAGSDALLTSDCFFKLKNSYLKSGISKKATNRIFGLNAEYQQQQQQVSQTPQNTTYVPQVDTRQLSSQQPQYQSNMYYTHQPMTGYYGYGEVPNFNYYAYDGQVFSPFNNPVPAAGLMNGIPSNYKIGK